MRSRPTSLVALALAGLLPLVPARAGDPFLAGLAHPAAPGSAVTVLDVDQDGQVDVVIADTPDPFGAFPSLSWLRGRGDGSHHPPAVLVEQVAIPPFSLIGLDAVDADRDGIVDLVLAKAGDPLVFRVLPGGGLATPEEVEDDGLLLPRARADVDANGLLDGIHVVTVGSIIGGTAHPEIAVTLDLGGGATDTLTIPPVQWFEHYGDIVPGDLDEDGDVDLVVCVSYGGQQLRVYRGFGDGTFAAPESLTMEVVLSDLALRDVDGDGHLDLLAAASSGEPPSAVVALRSGAGDGTFTAPEYTPVTGTPTGFARLVVGDVDGDARDDLLLLAAAQPAGEPPAIVSLFPALPGGGFAPERVFALEGHTSAQKVVDADGDGRLDLVRMGWVETPEPEGRAWVHRGGDGPVVSLGGGVLGGPSVTVTGTLQPDAPVSVSLDVATQPGELAAVLVSATGLWQPAAGGLLGPQAALVVPLGSMPVTARWPMLDPGVALYLQPWLASDDALLPGDTLALVTVD